MGAPAIPSRRWIGFLLLAFLAGAVLRNVWLPDMEYKYDERWMFEAARDAGGPDPWPWTGMRSGADIANPGMSIWVFAAPARLLRIEDPVALARVVAVGATLALALLMIFALRCVPAEEREPWLWGSALLAVNPGTVLLERKIWAQSTLPLFTLGALWGWWFRRTRWGAFLWGALGACLGQIHMSGLFFSAAVVLWTALFDRRPDGQDPRARRVRWAWWLAGSITAGWPLLPWALSVLRPGGEAVPFRPLEMLRLRFYADWIAHLAALHPRYSLGRVAFQEWLGWPLAGGHFTHAVQALYVAVLALLAAALVSGLWSWWKEPRSWRARLASPSSSALAQNAAWLGFGGLLTLSGQHVYPHYLLVAFPLVALWLARTALCHPRLGRPILAGLFAGYALLSAGFLAYVHVRGGAPRGDYGVSYSHQRR